MHFSRLLITFVGNMRHFIALAAFFCAIGANGQHTLKVTVENPSEAPRTDQPVVISLAQYGFVSSALVMETGDGKETPCQLDDLDQDEQADELCFLSDLGPREKKTYEVTLSSEGEPRSYPARVYAEMVMGNKNVKE